MDAALQVLPIQIAAPAGYQQADGVFQAIDIARAVGGCATHQQAQTLRAVGRLEGPVLRQPGIGQGFDHGVVIPLDGRPCHEFRQVGGTGRQYLQINRRQHAGALGQQVTHRVFMQVDDAHGPVVADQPSQALGLGGSQQQMVTVEVDAVGGGRQASLGTIRIGARHDDHIDGFEQRFQRAAAGQFPCQHQQRLGAGRLVAMLLAEQQHGRASAGFEGCHVGAASACQHQRRQHHAALRAAIFDELRLRLALAAQGREPLQQLGLGGEGAPACGQAGGVVAHGGRGKACIQRRDGRADRAGNRAGNGRRRR